jgi:hypothetical protein
LQRRAEELLQKGSVDDVRDSLSCARYNGRPYRRDVVEAARDLAAAEGRKTLVRLFEAELRRGARR